MLRKIKTFIGLHALELEVHLGNRSSTDNRVHLIFKWTTAETRIISRLNVNLKEDYTRGRWTRKHKQSFLLGSKTLPGPWTIEPDLPLVLDFELDYQPAISKLDKLNSKQILKPFIKGLAWIENLKSQYFLEITTHIQGAALPSIKRVDLDYLVTP